MPADSDTPENPILVWALTKKGEIIATFFADLAEVEHYGKINTDSGAWRTWDAFELPPDLDATRRVLVASHDKSKIVPAKDKRNPGRRYPILGGWKASATPDGVEVVPPTVHIDVPKHPRPSKPSSQPYAPPQHSRVRVLTDWTPIIPADAPGTLPPEASRPPGTTAMEDEASMETQGRRRDIAG
jgi:hypothetical protein